MFERLVILFALAVVIALLWGGLRLWRTWRVQQLATVRPFAALVPPGRPTVVAFSTTSCAECRTRQAPALAKVAAELGEAVAVRSLLVSEHPALVAQLGILTVPATVVLDAQGVVQRLNLGYTAAPQLTAQLRALAPSC